MRVIIVEDEGLTRKWIQKKIEELDMGFLVEGVFSNGSQGLKYLEKHKADVIFTDIQMPVMDGLELLEQVQKMEVQPYKVILSAYDEFHYARRAMKLGAQEFVLKPELTEESLRHILEEARSYREKNHRDKQESSTDACPGREALLRELIGLEGGRREGDPISLLAEQGIILAGRNLVMAVVFFDKTVRSKPVLELLNLFLEQEGEGGAACANHEQEFVILYHHDSSEVELKPLEQLREVLRTHTGTEVYLGVSSRTQNQRLEELYRQASLACENRRFFLIPGCQKYEDMRIMAAEDSAEFCFFQEIKQIGSYLAQKQYQKARDTVERVLEEMKASDYLHPSYAKTVCNEFLAAYFHELWRYSLTEDEQERVGAIKVLVGQTVSNVQILGEEAARAVEYMTELLKNKSGVREYSTAIQEVIEYVDKHYGERISLAQISEAIYLSQSYVSTLFKKETGKKFSNYLQEVRLEKSREMLLQTRLSVQEIADRTGFFDASHFSHVFKERYGLSPLEYKKSKNNTKNKVKNTNFTAGKRES